MAVFRAVSQQSGPRRNGATIDCLVVGGGDGHSRSDDRNDLAGSDRGLELVDLSLAKGHGQNDPRSTSNRLRRDMITSDRFEKPYATRSTLVARVDQEGIANLSWALAS